MKQLLLLIPFLCTWLMACQHKQNSSTHLVFLVDVTQSDNHPIPAQEQVKYELGYSDKSLWHGSTFSVNTISEARYNNRVELTLPPANQILSNEGQRITDIRGFLAEVDSLVLIADSYIGERKYSSVFDGIANELMQLEKKTGNRKLSIFSDLQHHSPSLSLYRKQVDLSSTISPFFDGLYLTGISVEFIYSPTSYEKLTAFEQTADVLKQILEAKGATVIISTQTNNNE